MVKEHQDGHIFLVSKSIHLK